MGIRRKVAVAGIVEGLSGPLYNSVMLRFGCGSTTKMLLPGEFFFLLLKYFLFF